MGGTTESRKVTIREVADRAGVALSSVSRVLNGHPAVSESLRQRVMSSVAALDYQPDFTASSLRRGSTLSMGFIVRDIGNPFFSDMVKAVEEELQAEGYQLLLANSNGDPDRDAAHIREFARRRMDGLFLSLSNEDHRETVAALQSSGIPLVLLDRAVPDIEASIVRSDHFTGVRAATRHLASRGHTRIALITGPREVLASRERTRGYKAGLRAAGIKFTASLCRLGSYSMDFGAEQIRQLMALDEPPTAVIAGGAMTGYGVLQGTHDLGLSIPDDLAMVGCDSWPHPELFQPALTVVRRSGTEIGRTAARLMLENAHQEVLLPTELVIGGTTPPLPAARR